MKNRRSFSVDIAKGISIIAIVLGHINFLYPTWKLVNTTDLFIYLWHVAVFFLLAGFFMKEEQLVQPKLWFKKKFSSLYLKILYFYVPAVLLHNALIKIGWYSLESTDPVINTYSMMDFVKQTVFAICLGGREPIVGAMWFVYVLFMALIGLSIVSWLIKKLAKDERQYEWMRGIALLAMCIVAGILSNKYGLTIRRFSNTFTAMLLIYVGKIMYQKMKLSFDNWYLAIICGLIAFEVACMLGGVALNGNEYKDILQLLVAAPAVLYIIMYIGKQIEANVVGKAIAYIGKESFYVMALHFVGFKLCTLALQGIGYRGASLSDLTPGVGGNILLLFVYAFFGVGFPLVFMWGFRRGKTIIQKYFKMNVIKTNIEGVLIIEPRLFRDARGYFFESFSEREFKEKVEPLVGYHVEFCQDNESMSSYGVMRGLHFQRPPFTQSKLVRCVKGRVLDVAVDIRKGSPTYGKHVAVELTEDNHRQFFIPKGFAHGFAVLSETAVFQYKCDNFYHPEADGGISILDESLGIDWCIPTEHANLSEKDTKHPLLKEFDSPFTF